MSEHCPFPNNLDAKNSELLHVVYCFLLQKMLLSMQRPLNFLKINASFANYKSQGEKGVNLHAILPIADFIIFARPY